MKHVISVLVLAICSVMQDPASGHKSAHCGFKTFEECERLSGAVVTEDLVVEYPHLEFKCQEGSGDAEEVINF